METYDIIGINYNNTRKADPGITGKIITLLDLKRNSVIADIGAGTGNYAYELALNNYRILAIEPSDMMCEQRKTHHNISWIKGFAEEIPLGDNLCDGAICIFTTHHFKSLVQSFSEIKRILKPDGVLTILTFDPRLISEGDWLREYFHLFHEKALDSVPSQNDFIAILEDIFDSKAQITPFPLPHDLTDSFFYAGWNHPEKYLDEDFRKGMSVFALASEEEVNTTITKLNTDLQNGSWDRKYGHMRNLKEFNADYFFVTIKL